MPIEFACQSCQRLLRVPDGSGGAQCECPACTALVQVPRIHDSTPHEPSSTPNRPVHDQPLKVHCPRCGTMLQCPSELIGTKGQCRKCKHIFGIVPNSDHPSASSPEADDQSEHIELVFTCPSCGQLFAGHEEMRGRRGKCHACGEVFVMDPQPAEAEREANSSPLPPSPTLPRTRRREIRIACPACSGLMEVPSSAAGKTTICPYCEQLLQIPNE